MELLRRSIRSQVRALVGSRETPPPPEGGLFPPGSACRKVHGDFTTMMIGGVSALLLQMLHPSALAGVWDHSNFRADMQGRLKRTARFVSATTFGPVDEAEQMIARVRAIHDRVHGTLPDGRTYSANDPAVLTWVHIAGQASFLASYMRYRDPAFSGADQDRYYRETAGIARRLGATDVPESAAQAADYLRAVRGELRVDHRSREVARALLTQPAPNLALVPFHRLVLSAGIDLLPDWAARMHGLATPAVTQPAIRAGATGVGSLMRWALR